MLVYHSWSRNKYLDLFDRLPMEVLTRKRGSTFESIWDVHLHVLGVYCAWLWGYFGQKRLQWIVDILETDVHTVRQLRDINQGLDAAAQAVASNLGPDEFDHRRPASESGPWSQRMVTPREVLWHLIEEDFLHHGEILCMLWQDDIEPPYTGVWWFEYDRLPDRFGHLWYADPSGPRPSLGGYLKQPPPGPESSDSART